jgi:hypothetical protein
VTGEMCKGSLKGVIMMQEAKIPPQWDVSSPKITRGRWLALSCHYGLSDTLVPIYTSCGSVAMAVDVVQYKRGPRSQTYLQVVRNLSSRMHKPSSLPQPTLCIPWLRANFSMKPMLSLLLNRTEVLTCASPTMFERPDFLFRASNRLSVPTKACYWHLPEFRFRCNSS